MTRVTPRVAKTAWRMELQLSSAAYDEIEQKLLSAGYDHMFLEGPGSAIAMGDVWITRAGPPTIPGNYCFGCDQIVTEPCSRADCLELKNREAQQRNPRGGA